jgi:hypothetical protein
VFQVYSPELQHSSPSGNPFDEQRQLIIRLDQLSRDEEESPTGRVPGPVQSRLLEAGWDLVLAIVLVNGDDRTDGPYYIRRPFDQEPGWGVSAVSFELRELLRRSVSGSI